MEDSLDVGVGCVGESMAVGVERGPVNKEQAAHEIRRAQRMNVNANFDPFMTASLADVDMRNCRAVGCGCQIGGINLLLSASCRGVSYNTILREPGNN